MILVRLGRIILGKPSADEAAPFESDERKCRFLVAPLLGMTIIEKVALI